MHWCTSSSRVAAACSTVSRCSTRPAHVERLQQNLRSPASFVKSRHARRIHALRALLWRICSTSLLLLMLSASCILAEATGTASAPQLASLTESNFTEQLQNSTSALVAFVVPWCPACKLMVQELERLHASLFMRSAEILVAFCDVSKEVQLGKRYNVWRTPVVLLFPDTKILAPGLQVPFTGHLQHANLLVFASTALNGTKVEKRNLPPPRLKSIDDLHRVSASRKKGSFVGFFRSSETDGPLHRFWPLDCLRRHSRAFAVSQGLEAEMSKDLWHWAGLSWDERRRDVAEEAILFVPSGKDESDSTALGATARFTTSNATGASWRSQVDTFCAWCERQLLAPVTIFDSARAAALDNTFEWLLLLFAPRSLEEDDGFPWEWKRLARFVAAACSKDVRYHDLLPVLVPNGGEEIATFRHDFGLGPDGPDVSMPTGSTDATQTSTRCGSLQEALGGDAEDAAAAGSARRRRAELWAAVLFNTRTRQKYLEPQRAGWTPGDELALCHFTDDVLNGQLLPHFRSAVEGASATSVAPDSAVPPGVAELVGTTFGDRVVKPILAGKTEVLLFLYAPWCSHSLNIFPLWTALASAESFSDQDSAEGTLLMAQMDGTQNEHLSLPAVSQFPTILLGVPAVAAESDGDATKRVDSRSGTGVTFLIYGGRASIDGIYAWLTKHSAYFQQNISQ